MAYITEYSDLGAKERRQLAFKRRYKHDRPAWEDSMELLILELQKRLPESHAYDVLDAGCGRANYVIDELQDRFNRTVGLDLAVEHTAGNTTVKEIVHGSLAQMPFKNAEFDVVVSLWVLEHIHDAETIFPEIARVLKSGGYFGFTTPNAKSGLILARKCMNETFAKRLVYKLYGREDADIFPVKYEANTVERIQELAELAGFDVEFLEENQDPSYTSFNGLTYVISKWLSAISHPFFRPHLVGVLKKR